MSLRGGMELQQKHVDRGILTQKKSHAPHFLLLSVNPKYGGRFFTIIPFGIVFFYNATL